MRPPPCKPKGGNDCPDRTGTCHDTCERYLAWREQKIAANRALKKEIHNANVAMDSAAAGVRRARRGRGRRK